MTKRKKKLKDLEVMEVSFATFPANNRKFFLIKEVDVLNKLIELLTTKFENEKKFEEMISKMQLSEEAKDAVKGALKLLYAYKDELPAEIIAELTKLLGLEYAEPEYPAPEEKEEEEEIEKGKKKEEEETEKDAVYKEQLERIMKENEELRERLEKEIRIRKEKDALLKVQKEFEGIPEKPENVAKVLVKIEEQLPEVLPFIEKILKGYSETIRHSLFKEIGHSGEVENSAWAKIEAMAKELSAKEKITKELAIARILEANPELYQEYLEEKKRR